MVDNERIEFREGSISKLLGLVRSNGYLPVHINSLVHTGHSFKWDSHLDYIIFNSNRIHHRNDFILGIFDRSSELRPINPASFFSGKTYLLIGELDTKSVLDQDTLSIYIHGRGNVRKVEDLAREIGFLFPEKKINLELKSEYNIEPYYYRDFSSEVERIYYENLRLKNERRSE